MAAPVELVTRNQEHTAVVRGRVPHGDVGSFIQAAFPDVMAAVAGVPIVGAPFCRIDMEGDDFLLEVGFPVGRPIQAQGRVEPSVLPGGEAATLLHTGPYDTVAPAYAAIGDWLAAHGYVSDGAPWEAYLDGPEVPMPRTVVTWPCRREDSGPRPG